MTFIQTEVKRYHDPAYEGAPADNQISNIISRRAVAETAFGLAILQGAADDAGVLADGTTKAFLGISVRDQSTGATSPNAFAANDTMRVMNKGTIWVRVTAAIVAGDGAEYSDAGALGKAGGAGTTIANARYETSAQTGELAILFLG